MTRRDKCHLIAKRAFQLNPAQKTIAWTMLAHSLDDLGETDMPKFKHLIRAIRLAIISAARK